MKISLISYTGAPDAWHAARLLVFTKNTRLTMGAARWQDVQIMTEAELRSQLAYMANTIPSSWEFVDYVFAVEGVTRAFTHQAVRTRTASFAQQSMRVTDMSGFDYRVPPKLTEMQQVAYQHCMGDIQDWYTELMCNGAAEEDARGVLPTNILTNICCKYNLRTMSDLVKSREGGRTQDEYRDVVRAMADSILAVHPWADVFLYPKGRNYFRELEEAVYAKISNRESRNEVLKIIDQMRKEP